MEHIMYANLQSQKNKTEYFLAELRLVGFCFSSESAVGIRVIKLISSFGINHREFSGSKINFHIDLFKSKCVFYNSAASHSNAGYCGFGESIGRNTVFGQNL